LEQPYLSALLAVILSRSTERVLLVLVGALAIYLGYRLFVVIPTLDRSEGRIRLPGGVSIFLTRIGPGVFFALFGCALIGFAVSRPVDLTVPTEIAAAKPAALRYSGLAEAPAAPDGALDAEVVVARLNGYLDDMATRLDRPAADELAAAVRQAKLAVMVLGWRSDWGERDAFARWVGAGADRDPPLDRAARAVVVFQTKLK
jgi:branched-subunit amino acid transport protein